MQNSHPVKYLSMPTSKTLLGIGAEVDSQLSYTFMSYRGGRLNKFDCTHPYFCQ